MEVRQKVNVKSKFSYVPIEINMLYKELTISLGTAFFYSVDNKVYLITNR